MPMNPQRGNMYKWVTHTWNPLGGRCKHQCSYCSTLTSENLSKIPKYHGPPELAKHEFNTSLKSGNTIFVGNMNDLWADDIPDEWIRKVIDYCKTFPDNKYLYQSKNPIRFIGVEHLTFPKNTILCTTIETNKDELVKSNAPKPSQRYANFCTVQTRLGDTVEYMITIEPIMDFDVDVMVQWIEYLKPKWVNVGADSKNCGLPEPSPEKVQELLKRLGKYAVTKDNIKRLLPQDG
jgi:DNA repair photolyase